MSFSLSGYTKIDVGPTGGTYSAPPDLLDGFTGLQERKGGETREWGREGKRKGGGEE